MYSYREAVKEDVKAWMEENPEYGHEYEAIFEACWIADGVTGNGSGSYTCNRLQAREYFFEDSDSDDYIMQMIDEGLATYEEVGKHMATADWEFIDVSIRCYLLGEAIQEVLDELEEEA